jgi:hypothetical protein
MLSDRCLHVRVVGFIAFLTMSLVACQAATTDDTADIEGTVAAAVAEALAIQPSSVASPTAIPAPTAVPFENVAPPDPLIESSPSPTPTPASQYVSATYGFSFDVPPGWIVIEDSSESVFAYEPLSDGYFAIELDVDTSKWGDGELWAIYWLYAWYSFIDGSTYELTSSSEEETLIGGYIWEFEEQFSRIGDSYMSIGIETFHYDRGLGTRVYVESSEESWETVKPVLDSIREPIQYPDTSNRIESGVSQLRLGECVQINTDPWYFGDVTKLSGLIATTAEADVLIFQSDCAVVGDISLGPELSGSGAFIGNVVGTNLEFTILGETNDVAVDLFFSGEIYSDRFEGVYTVADQFGSWQFSPTEGSAISSNSVVPTATPVPTPTATPLPLTLTFGFGSTSDEVTASQGIPTRIDDWTSDFSNGFYTWYYGSSTVRIDQATLTVTSYDNSGGNLRLS